MKIIVTGTRGIPGILGGVETHSEELYPKIKELQPQADIELIRRSAYVTAANKVDSYKGISIKTLYAPKSKSFEAIIHSFIAVMYAAVKRPDVLHVHAVGPNLVTPLARLLGLKVIMTHHGPDYERQKWGRLAKIFLKTGEWCGVKFANRIIVISEGIGKHLERRYHKKDYTVIPNGVPPVQRNENTDMLDRSGIEKGKYIFTLGRFVPEKGFDYLIRAFKKSGIHSSYKLVIAGDADHESDYSLSLKQLGKHNGIVMPGFVKGPDLQALFTHCRLFVLPSFYEGLPISLLEAMSYKCAILASGIDANREVKLPEYLYFEAGNEDQLAEKLQSDLSVQLPNCSYDLSRYNWSEIAGRTYAVYKEVLNRKKW
ncbi:MAG: glycosyltransferase family 4 protein [Niabella sp.]